MGHLKLNKHYLMLSKKAILEPSNSIPFLVWALIESTGKQRRHRLPMENGPSIRANNETGHPQRAACRVEPRPVTGPAMIFSSAGLALTITNPPYTGDMTEAKFLHPLYDP